MPLSHSEKATRFQSLHQRPGPFLIPNPWDIASAHILAQLGYEALATSSAAAANTLGRRDGKLTRDEALAHARAIANAVDIPVSADLENGFAHESAKVAETIYLAAEAGLSGCSIEDATGDKTRPQYEIAEAADRIAAAAEAARSLKIPFTLTARAENFIRGNPNLDDTLKRLVAYEKAGADVLFAPGLPDLAAVRTVCSTLTKPLNFMAAIKGKSFTVAELTDAGVKRISLAATLYRTAMTAFLTAAREVKDQGTFTYLNHTLTTPEFNQFLPE